MVDRSVIELLEKVAQQGAGVLLALLMFFVWLKSSRQDSLIQRDHIKRLEDILRERKSDRDALLLMLGKLEAHVATIRRSQ